MSFAKRRECVGDMFCQAVVPCSTCRLYTTFFEDSAQVQPTSHWRLAVLQCIVRSLPGVLANEVASFLNNPEAKDLIIDLLLTEQVPCVHLNKELHVLRPGSWKGMTPQQKEKLFFRASLRFPTHEGHTLSLLPLVPLQDLSKLWTQVFCMIPRLAGGKKQISRKGD